MSWQIPLHPHPNPPALPPTHRNSLQNRSPLAAEKAANPQGKGISAEERCHPQGDDSFPAMVCIPWLVNARTQKSGLCAPRADWTAIPVPGPWRASRGRGRCGPAVQPLCPPPPLLPHTGASHTGQAWISDNHVLKTAFLIKKYSLLARNF